MVEDGKSDEVATVAENLLVSVGAVTPDDVIDKPSVVD